MNKKITKIVFLAILGLVAAYFVVTRVLTESPEDKQWREQYEANQKARESGQAPAATAAAGSGGASTAAPAAAGSPAAASTAAIDFEQLASGIKEIEFDYDAIRKTEQRRNPMAPLVGPYVAPAVMAASGPGEAANTNDEAIVSAIRRNLLLSGIMWHPTAPVAIINNEAIPAGYTFPNEMFRTARSASGLEDAVTVKSMTQHSVILKYKDSEITLELKER
ncbi:MAG TPA: hypothetical protein PLB67_12290 [Candidatus Hydrogenedentes bacterium]|nr:hypothetical protein [Candidatus Hydrogenedentota bacterium]MDY0030640.1 hypothetical protein [FCB group bacterium]NLT61975.1 hypothetical protein [Candidatus Hydrogenedentota bacterium]HNZ20210.1 hypothetical protein [Candidatus Hydrogenedentota bacterium]HOH35615.1 hypothetical protein [Candidatus Hydrogenedentota bacterium]